MRASVSMRVRARSQGQKKERNSDIHPRDSRVVGLPVVRWKCPPTASCVPSLLITPTQIDRQRGAVEALYTRTPRCASAFAHIDAWRWPHARVIRMDQARRAYQEHRALLDPGGSDP